MQWQSTAETFMPVDKILLTYFRSSKTQDKALSVMGDLIANDPNISYSGLDMNGATFILKVLDKAIARLEKELEYTNGQDPKNHITRKTQNRHRL